MTPKIHQFIIEVQTGVILRCERSQMWKALIIMDDAFALAECIPSGLTAHHAACEFLEFVFNDNTDPGYKPPTWCRRI